MTRVLILGGSSEATRLVQALADARDIRPILSLAGRTKSPKIPPGCDLRIGGFGGARGLSDYLRAEGVDVTIDATHPFADQISRNAQIACAQARVPLARLTRPSWTPQSGDKWIDVASAVEAVAALGDRPRRVFLTIGRLELRVFEAAPLHDYLIRCVDPPDPPPALPRSKIICARGPFYYEDETALMRDEGVELLVTKNSGGDATRAKLDAARTLGIAVVMIQPPVYDSGFVFHDVEAALAFIRSHRGAP